MVRSFDEELEWEQQFGRFVGCIDDEDSNSDTGSNDDADAADEADAADAAGAGAATAAADSTDNPRVETPPPASFAAACAAFRSAEPAAGWSNTWVDAADAKQNGLYVFLRADGKRQKTLRRMMRPKDASRAMLANRSRAATREEYAKAAQARLPTEETPAASRYVARLVKTQQNFAEVADRRAADAERRAREHAAQATQQDAEAKQQLAAALADCQAAKQSAALSAADLKRAQADAAADARRAECLRQRLEARPTGRDVARREREAHEAGYAAAADDELAARFQLNDGAACSRR